MVFIASKHELEDYTIVEPDIKNPGFIQKQDRTLINKESKKSLDARVIGFVTPSKINGLKFQGGFTYEINTTDDWRYIPLTR